MIGVLLFSFSLPLTKVAVGGFDPFFTAMGRAVIAGTLATAVLLVRRVRLPPRQYFRPIFFTMLGAVFGWAILLALAVTVIELGLIAYDPPLYQVLALPCVTPVAHHLARLHAVLANSR